jgi:hypothetical protein
MKALRPAHTLAMEKRRLEATLRAQGFSKSQAARIVSEHYAIYKGASK